MPTFVTAHQRDYRMFGWWVAADCWTDEQAELQLAVMVNSCPVVADHRSRGLRERWLESVCMRTGTLPRSADSWRSPVRKRCSQLDAQCIEGRCGDLRHVGRIGAVPRYIPCGTSGSGEDVLVKVDTGSAQAGHEGEDVGRFEYVAQRADRRADSASECEGFGVVEQVESRNVTPRLDEQIPRPDPFSLGGAVCHHHEVIDIDHRAHQWSGPVVLVTDHAPPHTGDDTVAPAPSDSGPGHASDGFHVRTRFTQRHFSRCHADPVNLPGINEMATAAEFRTSRA